MSTRDRITALLREHPGVHEREMVRRLEVSRAAVRHHLTMLERRGKARSMPVSGRTAWFPADVTRGQRRLLAVLALPGAQEVLDAVGARPGAQVREVADALGVSPKVARHQLGLLERGGALQREGTRPARFWRTDADY